MCTVTFLRVANKYLITSNRDESRLRKTALPPAIHRIAQGNILFPKDANAGGTWIAVHENGNAVVLLNGAFIRHSHNPPYRKSRGIILLEIIAERSPLNAFNQVPFQNIEPFTMVLFCFDELYECRWDGRRRHIRLLDKTLPHMWSSATLYEPAIVAKREKWFANWLQENSTPSLNDIMHFHAAGGDGDLFNDLRMNREGHMLTVSITGIEISGTGARMVYKDLTTETEYQQILSLTGALTTNE
ncbi:NRDE family protein [Panacibacter sp. DH6]|uniref:NRDE family protein n=1 Tax=Panacibacter microcysteis TaxID=2793269 RepID=A0A931E7X8_9BACT|nr:NRDE family protein [Panacibacter microcysteis]MBG9377031.1 NRDE family protein [Panacibacter microcysteis]